MSALKFNLDQMPYRELASLHADISDAMKRAKTREAVAVRSELEQVAQRYGYSLRDILPSRRRSFNRHDAPVYRNPENPEQTWRGRGRRPGWFKDEMKSEQHTAA